MTPPDLNREVGEIKQQVRFLTQDISEIKSDVKKLLAFKWSIAGSMMVIGGLAAFLGEIAAEYMRSR